MTAIKRHFGNTQWFKMRTWRLFVSTKRMQLMRFNFSTPLVMGLLTAAVLFFHPQNRIAAQQSAESLAPTVNAQKTDSDASTATSAASTLESSEIETEKFLDVFERVEQEVAVHGSENVLLVVDIDNTTLAMEQPLGSDQWYDWQYNFIFKDIQSPDRVATDLNELLRIQGVLFTLGRMRPPEPEIPTFIKKIQQVGCCTIVLTSRGPEFRPATERELKRNGYDFTDSALKINEPSRGSFLPYDKARPNTYGLSKEELGSLRAPRPVSYSSGIMMSAGQHKGYMLRNLLARSQRTFRSVVFVDDHRKHTTRMTDAFRDSGITTACFHYVREQENVEAFEAADKKLVAEKWAKLNKAITKAFDDSKD